jgi:putative hemolysin
MYQSNSPSYWAQQGGNVNKLPGVALLFVAVFIVACGSAPAPVSTNTVPAPQSTVFVPTASPTATAFVSPLGTTMESPLNMANPASVYCVDLGYKLEIRDEANGQVGYCIFPNGAECEEWAFYRGECTGP